MPSSVSTEVKICGICREADAAAAAAAGASYVGVVLAPGFARTQSPARAATILAAAGEAKRVGVFVDQTLEEVVRAADELGLHVLQLHGRESAAYVDRVRAATGLAVWRALRPRTQAELELEVARIGAADGLLVEGWSPDFAGGTGARVPAAILGGARKILPPGVRLVLAGGLTPANVAELVALANPDVVDVSSGVESEVGCKNAAAITSFVEAALSAGGCFPGGAGRAAPG